MPDPCYIALTGVPVHNRDVVVGGTHRIEIDATTLAGAPVDPDKLVVKLLNGEAEETIQLVYGTDAALVKVPETTGRFYVDVELDQPGRWAFRAEAEAEEGAEKAEVEGVAEASFYVAESAFDQV